MFKVIIAISFTLLFVAVSTTPYTDCGTTWTLSEVRVPDCNTLPCIVYRGTNITVEYDVVSNSATQNLTTELSGTFAGITVPWPSDIRPPCDTLIRGDCPVEVNESLTTSTDLVIGPNFPAVRAKGTLRLYDEIGEQVVCFEITVDLQDLPTSPPGGDYFN